jgi:hypothetical protein
MQRLHENDVSGDILARESDYCHCLIPMYFDPLRYQASADGERTEDPETGEPFEGNEIGWIDPRALDEDGDILSPCELAQYDGERHGRSALPKRPSRPWSTNLVSTPSAANTSRVPRAMRSASASVGKSLINQRWNDLQGIDRRFPLLPTFRCTNPLS